MVLALCLVITSDRISSGQKKDQTEELVKHWCRENNIKFISCELVPDEKERIRKVIQKMIDWEETNLIITSGGTGFSHRDVTPEATRPLLEKLTPGIDEYLRREGSKDTPFAILSRGISGVVRNKIIINLPGNPQAVISSLNAVKDILPHALRTLSGASMPDSEHAFGEPDR